MSPVVRRKWMVALALMWMIAVITRASVTALAAVSALSRARIRMTRGGSGLLGGFRGREAVVDRGSELLVLHHDEQLRLRRGVQEERADRDVSSVSDLLRRHPCRAVRREQVTRGSHDASAFIFLRALAPSERGWMLSHDDLS